MDAIAKPGYSPASFTGLDFSDARKAFLQRADTPSAYLERCIQTIEEREDTVKAWVVLDLTKARESAAQSTRRYQAGKPLSSIDGMPVGVKDLVDTADMPTQMGCAAFKGHRPTFDAPVVEALRAAGAVIVGKTVTAELGMNEPGPTTNPFNSRHTPGGSSSGSAAAVGARMVPAAIGTQVGGSIIRPSSYCANYALKPTLGALNRRSAMSLSQEVYGVHASNLDDMWSVAIEIAQRTGGDPGYPGLYGPSTPPSAQKPSRMVVLETAAWGRLDDRSKDAFERFSQQLSHHNVEVLHRKNCPEVQAFELGIAQAKAITDDINSYELMTTVRTLYQHKRETLSARLITRIQRASTISQNDYRDLLQKRDALRRQFCKLAPIADALITLSSFGPAPVWEGDQDGIPLEPTPTGDSGFNVIASVLGAPAVTVPMLSVNQMPLGVQLIGQQHEDATLCAIARWIQQSLDFVAVP